MSVATGHMVLGLQIIRNGPIVDKVGLLRMSAGHQHKTARDNCWQVFVGKKPFFLGIIGLTSPHPGPTDLFRSYRYFQVLFEKDVQWKGNKEPIF